jgi:pheromone shutdown protein TraB
VRAPDSRLNLPSAEEMKRQMEELTDTDAITEALKEMGKEFPSLLRPLIYERDEYMVGTK